MELHLPVDFERLPEFRMLTQELEGLRLKPHSTSHRKEVECAASFIWMRLWVELAYLAQSTNQPGLLTKTGATLFRQSLEPLFGDDTDPLLMLRTSGVIAENGEGEFFCTKFSRLNGHLAGNFKSREHKGAASSALERNRNIIAHEANAQAMLLPPEIFKRRDGSPLNDSEVNRCMVVIKTIDNCLKISGRTKQQYTEGMIADASAAAHDRSGEELKGFYIWLSLNRDHPRVPKTTEQILAQFPELLEMSKG